VDPETRGSPPAHCDTVQVGVVPGSLKLVEARKRPPVPTEVLVEDRPAATVVPAPPNHNPTLGLPSRLTSRFPAG
jgi:hypothetical protein